MTPAAATPPSSAPPAPCAPLNRCGACASWEPSADTGELGVCLLRDCPQRRDAVACPEWMRRPLRLVPRRVH